MSLRRPIIESLYKHGALTGLDNVLVYGAGTNARNVGAFLSDHGVSILCFCDRDPSKHGSLLFERPVVPATELARYPLSTPVVVSPLFLFNDIVPGLLETGFTHILCGDRNMSGPFWPLDDVSDFNPLLYSAVLVLPPAEERPEYIMRGVRWFRSYFKLAHSLTVAAPASYLAHCAALLPETKIVPYERTDITNRHDVLVFMSKEDYSTLATPFDVLLHEKEDLFADTIDRFYRNRTYMMLAGGCAIRCTNRRTSNFTYPSIDHNSFMQLSSPDPLEHFFFFPFAVLHRDSSIGPINPLGFRIKDDIVRLAHREQSHKVIAVFGGSTTYSVCCLYDEMWPLRLQEKLNTAAKRNHSPLTFTVLNFGQPFCTLTNSIIHYLTFCNSLNPDFVIAHDGGNDFGMGLSSDNYLLNNYDLTLAQHFEEWARIIHGSSESTSRLHNNNTPDSIIGAYIRRKIQFENYVFALGGKFFWGLQPLLTGKGRLSLYESAYYAEHTSRDENFKKVDHLYHILQTQERMRRPNVCSVHSAFGVYAEQEDLFLDNVHTTPQGDEHIAEIYCAFLISTGILTKRQTPEPPQTRLAEQMMDNPR